MINAGLLVDLPHIAETGAAGIGLFRTELQFMVATAISAHQRAAVALPRGARRRRRPAGDVPHPRYRRRQGAALYAHRRGGEPGARLARDPARARPARACCAARCARCCAPRPAASCKVMFPMVAAVRRVRRGQGAGRARTHPSAPARPQAARAGRDRRHGGSAVAAVPARRAARRASTSSRSARTIWCSSSMPPTAAIRRVADRFDPLSAPVLRALQEIVDKGRAHGKPVTLCGELASKPIGALALIGARLSLAVAGAVGGRARSRRCCSSSTCARPRRVVLCQLLDEPVRKRRRSVDRARGLRRRRRSATL